MADIDSANGDDDSDDGNDGTDACNDNADRLFLILLMLPLLFRLPPKKPTAAAATDDIDEYNGNGTVRITLAFMIASKMEKRQKEKTKNSIYNQ